MKQNVNELILAAEEELKFASSPFLSLDFTANQAITLLGILQLVLRHPTISAEIRDAATSTAEDLECQLASLGPATRALCRLGWEYTPDFYAA